MSKMLSSWKEIAHFFGKGVRTVQRWEKTLDLPIHRPPGAPSNVVLARTSDLEEWMHRGPAARALDEVAEVTVPHLTLEALEREVVRLAEYVGVTVKAAAPGAPAQDRIVELADVMRHANAKLAGPSHAVRAA